MKRRQPVLFLGHGSPMNVISENNWTQKVSDFGASLERPDAIIMVSAHWLTRGLKILSSTMPKTIHDFRGFPSALYDVKYNAPGDVNMSAKLQKLLPGSELTSEWGYDHGTWGVLKFLIPQADVPVIPISLNSESTTQDFFDLGRKLKALRDENIMIVGSGNLVHNLRDIDFSNEEAIFPWAESFDQKVKHLTEQGDVQGLMNLPASDVQGFRRAHPTSEHWAPYLVCLGATDSASNVKWIFEGIQNGSISMRSAEWVN